MRRERPGREAGRVVGVEAVESRRDRVNKGGTVKFEKACPVLTGSYWGVCEIPARQPLPCGNLACQSRYPNVGPCEEALAE